MKFVSDDDDDHDNDDDGDDDEVHYSVAHHEYSSDKLARSFFPSFSIGAIMLMYHVTSASLPPFNILLARAFTVSTFNPFL